MLPRDLLGTYAMEGEKMQRQAAAITYCWQKRSPERVVFRRAILFTRSDHSRPWEATPACRLCRWFCSISPVYHCQL